MDIWRLIEENASCTGIVEALEGRFDASGSEIATAVDALIAELMEAELIAADSSIESAGPPPEVVQKTPFPAPEVERFTDMQDLLLLDPIHEVDDTGWPHTPATR